ncbi:MAG: type I DNA topoisomerase [Actinomycetaceae bacterium]|nr:type I DNA topoisomerase [Actinomycetaceae bacterium]
MPGESKLVIVESPAKAKTISNYLGSGFKVLASVGHVRDLPQPSALPAELKKGPYGKFAVNVEDDFTPYYVVSADKKKTVTELKRALKEADELYLATDEDREGEAIAWHLLEVLKPKVPVYRMVFHEITKEAISNALENTRELDLNLVDAQETRRILDRLYGYEVSPLLWRKVKAGASAGRVQSVATRLLVDRERERMAFIPASYWDIQATLVPHSGNTAFTATLVEVDGHRIATGRDLGDDGKLTKKAKAAQVTVLTETGALKIGKALEATADFTVRKIETKPYTRRPAAPFTTSTLQQEASRKLRMSSRDTMRIAQSLYENGYITYMRTDSTALSSQALTAARAQATALFGAAEIPEKPRVYAKKAKGAQEAHEAIRPAGATFRTPDQLAGQLSGAQLGLYDLIWRRTIASQMNDARGQTATVRAGAQAGTKDTVFAASGTVITDRGFLAVYEEGRDKERYGAGKDVRLPKLTEGDHLHATEVSYADRDHQTSPPPRYTEASLVKALEERGIGRPSTYAATIGVIGDRGYIERRGQALIPTWLAFSVTRLLEENLPTLIDYDFTAALEGDLDKIATGTQDRTKWLSQFYLGTDGSGEVDGLRHSVETLGDIDARAINSVDLGGGITVRNGRYGPYLEKEDGTRASVPADVAPDELTVEKATELFKAAADDGRELGVLPETGRMIVAKNGRFGPYVTEVLSEEEAALKGAKKIKPLTASLLKSQSLTTITLEDALALLRLPREVGTHPETGKVITAQNGRFGAYLKMGTDSRSLENEEQIFTITLEDALALYAQPKQRRTAKPPLRDLGEDPHTGLKVTIKDGRFGPYITDGKTNVTVPRIESVEDISAERCFDLLADKRAKGPTKKKTTKKTTKKTKKVATAKKTTKAKSAKPTNATTAYKTAKASKTTE